MMNVNDKTFSDGTHQSWLDTKKAEPQNRIKMTLNVMYIGSGFQKEESAY